MNALPATLPQAALYQPSAEDIQTLKDFVWKGATDSQLRFALATCQRYGFDPLLKHVVFISGNIYTTRDGLLHLAHKSGQFNGMQNGIVYAMGADGQYLRNQGGKKIIDSAWARVYRKDMLHPFEVSVDFEEYNTGQNAWKSNPGAMIVKVAEHMALKRAFNVSGLCSVEEIGHESPSIADNGVQRSAAEQARYNEDKKALMVTIRTILDSNEDILTLAKAEELTKKSFSKEAMRRYTLEELDEIALTLDAFVQDMRAPMSDVYDTHAALVAGEAMEEVQL